MDVTILDLGSNSFQLLHARCTRSGEVQPLFRAVEFVALASHLTPDGDIKPEGFELGVQAVKDLLHRAPPSAHKHPLAAVATCAVREAPNGPEFLSLVESETGVKTRPIPGEVEARFAYRGAAADFADAARRTAVVDIGGGSTQIAVGTGPEVDVCVSVPLGVLALVERLAASANTANYALDQMSVYVRRTLEPSLAQLTPAPEALFFASGVARVIRDLLLTYDAVTDGSQIQCFTLRELIPKILETSPEELAERGVPEERLHSVGPTAIVLDIVADLLALESFSVSRAGLREGAALSTNELDTQRWPSTVKATKDR